MRDLLVYGNAIPKPRLVFKGAFLGDTSLSQPSTMWGKKPTTEEADAITCTNRLKK